MAEEKYILPPELLEMGSVILKYMQKDVSMEQEALLKDWILKSENNKKLFDELQNNGSLIAEMKRYNESITRTERAKLRAVEEAFPKSSKVKRMAWYRYATAAAIILVLTLGGYLWYRGDSQNGNITKTDLPQTSVANDVNPGQFKAKLILADGSSLVLDSAATGKLAQQGNVTVLNKDGKLAYIPPDGEDQEGSRVLYNTLETSKGQTYVTVLSDNSKVWLNAESSISYPVAFTGKERKVTITGEAYFEVAKDEKRPFIVAGNKLPSNELGWVVEVMGTHFNINSYVDEDMIKTTLLEGKVKVVSGKALTILRPGQQAQLKEPGQLQTINNADMEQAVAWKNGFFQFDNADLRTVMKQIARWYDVEVVYEGNISSETYGGKIRRNSKASEVLTLLEQNQVHFKIQGKRIIVY